MDTSETYIKMCDCEEIQSRAKDYTYFLCEINIPVEGIFQFDNDFLYHKMNSENLIWLPRQDQLQEMVIGHWNRDSERTGHLYLRTCVSLAVRFASFVRAVAPTSDSKNRECSMEQLWLAFVMKELHNKVWDGEHWDDSS